MKAKPSKGGDCKAMGLQPLRVTIAKLLGYLKPGIFIDIDNSGETGFKRMAETKFQLKMPEFKPGEKGNKTRLYILIGILGVLVIIAVSLNFSLKKAPFPEVPKGDPEQEMAALNKDLVQVLPQLERNDPFQADEGEADKDWLKIADPFALPVELVGLIFGGRGGDLAIIKARKTTYIAGIGEKIAGAWEVMEINQNSVRLKSEIKEIVVELGPRE